MFFLPFSSAGGTFIRILFGTRKQLHPGMIVLLGKHQFTVSSIDDGAHSHAAHNELTDPNDAAAMQLLGTQLAPLFMAPAPFAPDCARS